MFRRIRITILLLILAVVALNTWTDSLYTTSWKSPMVVALFPINPDGSEASDRYIAALTQQDFAPLEEFFAEQARAHDVNLDRPISFTLAPQLTAIPPAVPRERSAIKAMIWSLKFRWWAWRTPPKPPGPTPRIRLFLAYFEGDENTVLEHSTGLKKGLLGIVNLFADRKMAGANHAVIAHELLHTVGATDKYDVRTTLPIYPDGYAEPDARPPQPQRFAELMAGRIPISPTDARIPASLRQVVIGPRTAEEIGWIKR